MENKNDEILSSDILNKIKCKLDSLSKNEPNEIKWKAQQFLDEFQKKENSLNFIIPLINSVDKKLKFFGLQILEKSIEYNWKNLSDIQKNFVFNFIFESIYNKNPLTFQSEELFCKKKIKYSLVKIILQLETTDIFLVVGNLIEQATLSTFFFETNIDLIKIFFDDILLNQNNKLRDDFQRENSFMILLKKIENLCICILEKTDFLSKQKPNLIITCLKCLEKMVKIIPNEYSFENHLFILLILICPNQKIMNYSLECLIELAIHENKTGNQIPIQVFTNFIIQFQELLSISFNVADLYKIFSQENKRFILNTVVFITSIFEKRFDLVESENFTLSSFFLANQLMVKFSCIPSIEIYKSCLNWWKQIVGNNLTFYKNTVVNELWEKLFMDLRIILTCRMAKPEEILIRENEHGQISSENIFDTDASEIYKKSKKLFLFLADLNKESTQEIILEKLIQQFNPKNWNYIVLNSVCWAIGSISSIFAPEIETSKIFFVTVLKNLLYLCEIKKKKKTKK